MFWWTPNGVSSGTPQGVPRKSWGLRMALVAFLSWVSTLFLTLSYLCLDSQRSESECLASWRTGPSVYFQGDRLKKTYVFHDMPRQHMYLWLVFARTGIWVHNATICMWYVKIHQKVCITHTFSNVCMQTHYTDTEIIKIGEDRSLEITISWK